MTDRSNKVGAGFIVFKKDTVELSEPLILALVREDGQFDIPKGEIDDGESTIAAAKRECFEECSLMIDDDEIMFDSFVHGRLTTYCAATNKLPIVTKNPHTGILEHTGFKWVGKEEFCNNCLSYLAPAAHYFYSECIKYYNH
tara:strand:- start:3212 stop:3637 length:426 start_codon:yes stop_codon:yes gene_type:complete